MAPRAQKTSTTRLPKRVLDELQLVGSRPTGSSRRRTAIPRKNRRKNQRLEKKQSNKNRWPKQDQNPHVLTLEDECNNSDIGEDQVPSLSHGKPKQVGSNNEIASPGPPSNSIPYRSPPKQLKRKITGPDTNYVRKAIKDKLAQDDAAIAVLEKRLKIKSNKLPKTFTDDGLDFVLDGLDFAYEPRELKRKRSSLSSDGSDSSGEIDTNGTDSHGHTIGAASDTEEYFEGSEDEDGQCVGDREGIERVKYLQDTQTSMKDKGDEGKDQKIDDGVILEVGKTSTNRSGELDIYGRLKNTHVSSTVKYVPPFLRNLTAGEDELLTRLRRQIQGHLNRLSEPTLLGAVAEIEKLYRNSPRNHVTSVVTDLLIAVLCDRSNLLDTFMILHAGLIAALYKLLGAEFGAHITQRIVDEFDKNYEKNKLGDTRTGGKECLNMISLLSELYNLQVVGCTLIYDFVRMFLKDITELNTELLLKIVRNCGSQLRADDPYSLKDLVLMMQASVTKMGETNLSVRTKFMIESVMNLKNNKLKIAAANSVLLVESTYRMKKVLGSLNPRQLHTSEPLRITLEDIRNAQTKGKWWLVGASWRGNTPEQQVPLKGTERSIAQGHQDVDDDNLDGLINYAQLAREQRMNTDVRRAIFVTIMSSEDYEDACQRLVRLRLKKAQEKEVPRVILHCCGSEAAYNPYYTLVSRHLCGQHTLKMAFQFALWGLFRQMGEDDGSGQDQTDDDRNDEMPMRKIVNLAKLYGGLVAESALSLHILKTLNLTYLQPRTKNFLEVFFITIFLRTQAGYEANQRHEKAIVDTFLKVNNHSTLTHGILYFLKKHVKNTDIAGGVAETETVRWGARVAVDALRAATVAQATG